ncbi:hypothetical protein [Muricomes intestini]|uniref:Uncharacterized protein n=1 Tax=Muricomes intestini TaxID=1796634 RepID=A0A4R3JXS2_9FIRM|nr:hypothetical protein [Muricomes intestini]TCS72004.1 hypothetical protein EDD59_1561 [Muricomes intestini]
MSFVTVPAFDTADMKRYRMIFRFHSAVIVSMDGKAGRMPTSTGQLVELNGINCFIVKIL